MPCGQAWTLSDGWYTILSFGNTLYSYSGTASLSSIRDSSPAQCRSWPTTLPGAQPSPGPQFPAPVLSSQPQPSVPSPGPQFPAPGPQLTARPFTGLLQSNCLSTEPIYRESLFLAGDWSLW